MTVVIRAALAAVDPDPLMRQALADSDVDGWLRAATSVDVVAAGKAARAMLAGFRNATPVRSRHVIAITDTPHPVPDDRSVAAAREALDLAAASGRDDMLVVLLSGGASSMMALPAEGVSLADKRQTVGELLRSGAEIHEFNSVRKHLSAIKGGRLAAACAGSTLTLALSDVVDDDLSAIGSGPTVGDTTTYGRALTILDAHGGRDRYPAAVVTHLMQGAAGRHAETPKPGDPRLARSHARVIGRSRTAVEGVRTAATALGYAVHVIERPTSGEARLAAQMLIDEAARVAGTASAPVCIVAGGETVVRMPGTGKGGRNQECALAMVRGLDGLGRTAVACSVGTDGVDGPTDAAGAVVDTTTAARAQAAGLGAPDRYLDHHNSFIFFDELGDLIQTGPTGTNVGDVQVILIGG